jgi:hypothetical protein
MTDPITHRLVGYDRTSGHVAVEYDIPDRLLQHAKRVASVGVDDPQAVLCYRLDDLQARELAAAVGVKIDPDQLNFYVEGFTEAARAPDRERSSGAVANASRLLAEVRLFRAQQGRREWERTKAAFKRIQRGWEDIRWQRIQSERKDAPRHNLIRLLGLERSEVAFHSPFLCDLLNPFGTHGQGLLLLRSFLDLVSDKARRDDIRWDYKWQESAALHAAGWSVLGEREKIDISIRNRNQRILIYIENKIDHGFHDRQLSRYRERLEQEIQDYDHRMLILLTPRDYDVSDPQVHNAHVHLTYEDDILPWIDAILRDSLPVTLRGNLLQYQKSLSLFAGDPPMANQELIELIAASRDNLSCAWDIVAEIDRVEKWLKKCFWRNVRENLLHEFQKPATDLELRIGWSVQFCEESPKIDPEVYICSAETRALKLGVFQEGGNIYYGIRFWAQQLAPLPAAVQDLRDLLPREWRGPDDWWLGWHDTRYETGRGGEFLLNVAENATGVSQPMTDAVIRVLRDHAKRVIAANAALANASRP